MVGMVIAAAASPSRARSRSLPAWPTPTICGRPIASGCDGTTRRVDRHREDSWERKSNSLLQLSMDTVAASDARWADQVSSSTECCSVSAADCLSNSPCLVHAMHAWHVLHHLQGHIRWLNYIGRRFFLCDASVLFSRLSAVATIIPNFIHAPCVSFPVSYK